MALSKECASYMEDMLTCSICLELVKEPQTLMQCFHNYCKQCSQQLLHKQNNRPPGVKCPLCHMFSADGEIRNNHFVNDLLGLHSKLNSESTTKVRLCDHCSADKPALEASWRCIDCKEYLCDTCKSVHSGFKALRGHRLLEVNEDTDLVVDKLVFCDAHADEMLKLYCHQCKDVICIMCQVVTHKQHDTVTIQQALDTMLPQVDQNLADLVTKLEDITKAMGQTEEQRLKIEKMYDDCVEMFEKKIDERMKQLQRAKQQVKDKIMTERALQVKTFEDIKANLEHLHTQLSHLQKVTTTIVERARHVTLLQQLMEGGLFQRLCQVNTDTNISQQIKLDLPTLDINDSEWDKLVQEGLCGKVRFNDSIVKVGKGSEEGSIGNAGARHWNGDFTQVFDKQLKQTLKIDLPGICYKVTIFDDKVWAPICSKNIINVYNKQGKLQESIPIQGQPICVEKSPTGEILVCCYDTGLFQLIEGSQKTVNIDRGQCYDLCLYGEKVYTWEQRNKQIVEFRREEMGWKRHKEVKVEQASGVSHLFDTLLVTQCEGVEAGVEFIVCLTRQNKILKISEDGVCVSQYVVDNERGDKNVPRHRVCGMDTCGNILVADVYNKKYKVLDTNTSECRTVFTADGKVFDAKVDDKHKVWLSRYSGGHFVITKHESV